MNLREFIKVGKIGQKIRSGMEDFIVEEIEYDSIMVREINSASAGVGRNYCWSNLDKEIFLINNLNNMNLVEKFKVQLKSEPERSFRKAEITNGDDMLTNEGTEVFLSWLLSKHGKEFKTEVVDKILKEEKKK